MSFPFINKPSTARDLGPTRSRGSRNRPYQSDLDKRPHHSPLPAFLFSKRMELTNYVREGNLESLEKWFEDNPEPTQDDITNGGVSIAHWAASGDNTAVRLSTTL